MSNNEYLHRFKIMQSKYPTLTGVKIRMSVLRWRWLARLLLWRGTSPELQTERAQNCCGGLKEARSMRA
ncbi:hypothetical protein RchiOBHm_Chr3g0459521 [Rosa chinensis]|uniref:Uncharacterized protein n=1 Tax=Rosa chinensis TaxID=74649 RepID=A0A2P6R866_ROSCH|nr:hypothetical protein RchiOBHm_Chr3g0459521 [Rosa chinensis]